MCLSPNYLETVSTATSYVQLRTPRVCTRQSGHPHQTRPDLYDSGGDIEGAEQLAVSYSQLNRTQDALQAGERALALTPDH